VASKIDMAWASERDMGRTGRAPERWSPLACVLFATASSLVLWALIIKGLLHLL
jgi:hypothetical protein